jgi:hypothetical protein
MTNITRIHWWMSIKNDIFYAVECQIDILREFSDILLLLLRGSFSHAVLQSPFW